MSGAEIGDDSREPQWKGEHTQVFCNCSRMGTAGTCPEHLWSSTTADDVLHPETKDTTRKVHTSAELAQAEARARLQEAALWWSNLDVKREVSWYEERLNHLREALSAQPIQQAPQVDVVMCDHIDGVPCEPYVSYRRATQSPDLEIVAESIIAMLGSAYAQQGNTAHPGEKWSQMVLAELKAIAKQPNAVPQAPQADSDCKCGFPHAAEDPHD